MSATHREESSAASGAAGAGLAPAVAMAIGVQALATAAALALTTIAPLVAAELGVPPQWIGYQVSLVYLSATLLSIVAGGLVRKYGPARVSQLALLTGAIGLVGLASGSIAVAVVASLCIGFGYALTNPAASEVLNRLTPPRKRNLIFSLKQTGVPIGGVYNGLAMPTLALLFGWNWALIGLAVLLAAMKLALWPARRTWDVERNPALPLRNGWLEGLRTVWQRPGLRALGLMGLLYSAMQLALTSFLVVMLVEQLGWSAVAAGAVAAAVQLAGVAGRLFWGALADRAGRGAEVLAVNGGLTCACALAMAFAPALPAPLLVALLLVFGAGSIGWNGVMLAEAARLSPARQVAPVAGGVLMLTFSGVMLGPALFALAFEALRSYAATFVLFAAGPAVGGALVLTGQRREAALARQG